MKELNPSWCPKKSGITYLYMNRTYQKKPLLQELDDLSSRPSNLEIY